jgi:hypothetical protein
MEAVLFEKRTKNFCDLASKLPAPPRPIRKSLLLLFFRKEDPSLLPDERNFRLP